LRVSTGMRYALLNPVLDELMKEGRIWITVTMKRDIVSLVLCNINFANWNNAFGVLLWHCLY
jgi:hypothetical protein